MKSFSLVSVTWISKFILKKSWLHLCACIFVTYISKYDTVWVRTVTKAILLWFWKEVRLFLALSFPVCKISLCLSFLGCSLFPRRFGKGIAKGKKQTWILILVCHSWVITLKNPFLHVLIINDPWTNFCDAV